MNLILECMELCGADIPVHGSLRGDSRLSLP